MKGKKGWAIVEIIMVLMLLLVLGAIILAGLDKVAKGGLQAQKAKLDSAKIDTDLDGVALALDGCDCRFDEKSLNSKTCENVKECNDLIEINNQFEGEFEAKWDESKVQELFSCMKKEDIEKEKSFDTFIAKIKTDEYKSTCEPILVLFQNKVEVTNEVLSCSAYGKCVDKNSEEYICLDKPRENIDPCIPNREHCCEAKTYEELASELPDKLNNCQGKCEDVLKYISYFKAGDSNNKLINQLVIVKEGNSLYFKIFNDGNTKGKYKIRNNLYLNGLTTTTKSYAENDLTKVYSMMEILNDGTFLSSNIDTFIIKDMGIYNFIDVENIEKVCQIDFIRENDNDIEFICEKSSSAERNPFVES